MPGRTSEFFFMELIIPRLKFSLAKVLIIHEELIRFLQRKTLMILNRIWETVLSYLHKSIFLSHG